MLELVNLCLFLRFSYRVLNYSRRYFENSCYNVHKSDIVSIYKSVEKKQTKKATAIRCLSFLDKARCDQLVFITTKDNVVDHIQWQNVLMNMF